MNFQFIFAIYSLFNIWKKIGLHLSLLFTSYDSVDKMTLDLGVK